MIILKHLVILDVKWMEVFLGFITLTAAGITITLDENIPLPNVDVLLRSDVYEIE